MPAYKLIEIAAAGTFGTVCIVQDLDTGRLRALKVLKKSHLHRPRVIARTRDEAAIMSKIDHPGIAKVHGLLDIEQRPLLVMEWVRGLSLEAILKGTRKPFPPAEALEMVAQATAALSAAYHTRPAGEDTPMHVIHRDIKPSNIVLSIDGELKVVDFGIARGEFSGKEAKTMSMVLGARGYLAPERLDGHADHPSCDIYSLGICLYELIAGRHVMLSVHRDYHADALNKALAELRPSAFGDEALQSLHALVAGMCQYEASKRFDHQQVVRAIRQLQSQHGLVPDLKRFARDVVFPLFAQRKRVKPIDHPSYPDLAFIERPGKALSDPAAPDVDEKLSEFLDRPDWVANTQELNLLLVQNPHWSARPFVDLLVGASRPAWRFWDRRPREDDEIRVALQMLRHHPSATTRESALPYLRHAKASIRRAAELVLDEA